MVLAAMTTAVHASTACVLAALSGVSEGTNSRAVFLGGGWVTSIELSSSPEGLGMSDIVRVPHWTSVPLSVEVQVISVGPVTWPFL